MASAVIKELGCSDCGKLLVPSGKRILRLSHNHGVVRHEHYVCPDSTCFSQQFVSYAAGIMALPNDATAAALSNELSKDSAEELISGARLNNLITRGFYLQCPRHSLLRLSKKEITLAQTSDGQSAQVEYYECPECDHTIGLSMNFYFPEMPKLLAEVRKAAQSEESASRMLELYGRLRLLEHA